MNVFDKLKAQLELMEWPNLYLYKFIIPNENEKLAQITALFDYETSEISYHESGKGNYVSVSVKEVAVSVDQIIEKYQKASEIKGVISL
jgi:putative lipoic acid-binding regulatory protein